MGGKFFGLFILMILTMLFYYFYNHPQELAKSIKNGLDLGFNKNYLSDLLKPTSLEPVMYPTQNKQVTATPIENYVRIYDQYGNIVSEYSY